MASRKKLKKSISYIAGDLFVASLVEGVDREVVINAINRVLDLVPRISHTEPGKTKEFYKQLESDLKKEIEVVANELNKASKQDKE